MTAIITDTAIKAAAVAGAGGAREWDELGDEAVTIALAEAKAMLEAAMPHIAFDRRPVGEVLSSKDSAGIRWLTGAPAQGDKLYTSPPHVLPSHCMEFRQLLAQAIDAEKSQWTGDHPKQAWQALDDALATFDHLCSLHPVIIPDTASILRYAAAVLDMWEGDPNETGYMGDFGDAAAILELMASNSTTISRFAALTKPSGPQ